MKIVFALFFIIASCYGEGRQETLDPRVVLGWEVKGEEIHFDLSMKVSGFNNYWYGFGVAPKGSMRNADILIMVNETNYQDRHGPENAAGAFPSIDDHQDWIVYEKIIHEDFTKFTFSRKLETCDDQDYPIKQSDTINVIWAFGEYKNEGGVEVFSKHLNENRGTKSMNLLDKPNPPIDLAEFEMWPVRVRDKLPAKPTSYWCTIHKKTFANKSHLIGFDAYIPDEVARRHTHHFVVNKCTPPRGQEMDYFEQFLDLPGGDCGSETHMPYFIYCQTFIYVWAVGGKMMLLPEDMGLAVGDQGEDEYLVFQIHYDNPDMLPGIVYETGLDIYYTEELREKEVGIMSVMHDVSMGHLIAPEVKSWTTVGHCDPKCTREHLPETGITIFNAFLHSHLRGRQIKVHHYRGDVELPWLAYDDNYDFDFQQNRPLPNEIQLMPGDQLAVECTYDTIGKKEVTIGGEGTYEEMCQALIWYYPKKRGDLHVCGSTFYPFERIYRDRFGIQEFVENPDDYYNPIVLKPENMTNKRYIEILNEHDWAAWTDQDKKDFENELRYEPHATQCFINYENTEQERFRKFYGKTYQEIEDWITYPKIEKSYVPPNVCKAEEETGNRQEEELDPRVILGWEVVGNEIRFDISMNVTGFNNYWYGFGVSSKGTMRNADIITIVDVDNYQDRHGPINSNGAFPNIDQHPDWVVNEKTVEGEFTKFKFSRKLDTCDDEDYPITASDTLNVIWAFGEYKNGNGVETFSIHLPQNKGTRSMNLLDKPNPPIDLSEYYMWPIRVKDEVPAQVTSYYCTIHKKTFEGKHHIIGFDAYIPDDLARRHTHHFVVTKCVPPRGEGMDYFEQFIGQPGGDCNEHEQMLYHAHCNSFVYVWAVGGKMLLLPEDMGLPVGEDNADEYLVFQIHYDNPTSTPGIQYETGLNVYYSNVTREKDVGMMVVSHDVSMGHLIVPEAESWTTSGHCDSKCSEAHLPQDGVTIFNVFLHSHLRGRKLKLRHFRGEAEHPWIAHDDNYDFNFQQNRPLQNEIKFMPGDHLTTECTFDTIGKKEVTIGGEGTHEEMCQALIWYYPRKRGDLHVCSSTFYPFEKIYKDRFLIEEFNWTSLDSYYNPTVILPKIWEGMRYSEVLNKHDWDSWTKEKKKEFEDQLRYEPHASQCYTNDDNSDPEIFRKFNGKNDEEIVWVTYPKIEKEYVKPDICAIEDGETTTNSDVSTTNEDSTTNSDVSTTNEDSTTEKGGNLAPEKSIPVVLTLILLTFINFL